MSTTSWGVGGRGRAIPPDAVERLRTRGLLVGEPFPSAHMAYPLGVVIAKPTTVPGNARPGKNTRWGGSASMVDTPSLYLFAVDACWYVEVWEFVPGPGRGDFRHRHGTWTSAVDDVLDYFFGTPQRVTATAPSRFDPVAWAHETECAVEGPLP